MKPQRLEIEGFTAFRERQAIDLGNLGLFAITGPTGSGKTSILDAMTLALYGEVPRAAKGSGTLQDLISHGKRRASVAFEFLSGSIRYRVQRRLPRNGAQDVLLHRWEQDEWKLDGGRRVGETNTRIEEIVGLDFDAFTRAVLLPQGAFGDFLTGKPDERRKILIRLMDLGRYERAGELARRRNLSEGETAVRLQQLIAAEYGDATAEGLAEATRLAQECTTRADTLAKLLEVIQALATEVARLDQNRQQIATVVQELDAGREQLSSVAGTWASLRPGLEAAQRESHEASIALASVEGAWDAARTVRDETLCRAGDLGRIRGLVDAAESWTRECESVEHLSIQITSGEAEWASLVARQQETEQAANDAMEVERQARAEAEARRIQLLQADQLVQDADRRERVAQQVEDAQVALEEASAALIPLLAKETAARQLAAELRQRSVEVRHRSYAVALRAHLQPGQPCPVCEQRVGRIPEGGEEAQLAIEASEQEARRAEQDHQTCAHALGKAREQEVGCRAMLDSARKTLVRFTTTLATDKAVLAMEGAAEAVRLAQEVVSRAEETRQLADSARENARLAVAEGGTNLEQWRERLAGACARRDRAVSIIEEAFPDGLPDGIRAVLEQREAELRAAEAGFERAGSLLAEARRKKDDIARHLAGQEAASVELSRRSAIAQSALMARADDLRRLTDSDTVPGCPETSGLEEGLNLLLPWSEAVYAKARQVETALEQRITGAQQMIQRELAAARVTVPMTSPASITTELKGVAEIARAEAIRAESAMVNLETRIQARRNLEEQVRKARDLADRFGALAAELKADRFISYVLRESLEQLALQASTELRAISGDRYSLRAAEGSFRVVDHVNADEERSVATLSGGETFLASLSLALALSTGLTTLAGHTASSRLEAIFIDEGFGSLDPETLEVVVDALERLQGGERTVGVITHVPILAERIQAGLIVSRGTSGSTVLSR